MRLLNTETGQVADFVSADEVKYAILSHTWDAGGEQTYQDVRGIQTKYDRNGLRSHSSPGDSSSLWGDAELSDKIRNACAVARAHGFRYIWIDSCCIDKTSSSELSEAINSMFSWYRKSTICYAFLADVPEHHAHERFPHSRWFTRGWTLQELIAPRHLVFLTSEWKTMGTKMTLAYEVEKATGIDYFVLVDKQPLDEVGVARRMSWAATRQTTRIEDEAYSLLGIFDIKMPTVYGEGRGAFRRLQEEIMRRIPDQSIFALGGVLSVIVPLISPDIVADDEHPEDPYGFMANSPRDFHLSGSIRPVPFDEFRRHRCGNISHLPLVGFTSSPYGLCVQFAMVPFCESIDPHYITRLPRNIKRLPYLWLILLSCEDTVHPGCLLARVCVLKGSGFALDLSSVYSVRVVHKASGSAHPYTMLPWSPTRAEQLSPRPTLHVQPVYILHVDTSDWSSRPQVQAHSAGRPRPFQTDINMALALWAADALRGEGFSVHLCRWMSPINYPIHRLVLLRSGYAAFELVFYLSVDRDCGFLRFIASSMDEVGQGFGFEDHVDHSVVELNTARNSLLNYDMDGPDIFLSTMARDEIMMRLTVEEPERPLEGGCTHYLFVEVMQTGRKSRQRVRASVAYQIDFGSV